LVGVLQLGGFLIAACMKTDQLTDVLFGSNIAAIAAFTFAMGGTYYSRQYLITIAVVLWAVRLATFLSLRVQRTGRDPRFDSWERGFSIRFFGFWVLQAAYVYVTTMNAVCNEDPELGAADYIGFLPHPRPCPKCPRTSQLEPCVPL
jgi:steroid 5-alpha reductase family enzyme